MPSPLSGLTHAAASPMSAQLRPATFETAPPIGSSAEVSIRSSSPRPNSSRSRPAYSAISGLIATSAGRFAVASVPAPRLTSPLSLPSGKIQP